MLEGLTAMATRRPTAPRGAAGRACGLPGCAAGRRPRRSCAPRASRRGRASTPCCPGPTAWPGRWSASARKPAPGAMAACRRRCPPALPGGWRRGPGDAGARHPRLGARCLSRAPAQGRRRPPLPASSSPPGTEQAVMMAEAICAARDLINAPAADLGPAELAEATASLAARHGATCEMIAGDCADAGFPRRRRGRRRQPSRPPRRRAALDRRGGRAADRAVRQGGLLRHRRARPQDPFRHAAHEEGHGRRRRGARRRRDGDAQRPAGPAAGAGRGGGERHLRDRHATDGCAAHAQGPEGRGRQHRCGRPAGTVRPADVCVRNTTLRRSSTARH